MSEHDETMIINPRGRARQRAKWLILLFAILLLAFAIATQFLTGPTLVARNQPTATPEPTIPTATINSAMVAATHTPETIVETPLPDLIAPAITGAPLIGLVDDKEQLQLAGKADPRCTAIRFLLNNQVMGETVPSADGSWVLNTAIPAAGSYQSQVVCDSPDGLVESAAREFVLPERNAAADEDSADTDDAMADDAATDSEAPAAADAATDGSDETAATDDSADAAAEEGDTSADATADEATAPAAADAEQPTIALANDMTKWVGGPLLLRGTATPSSTVEIVVNSGETQMATTAVANADGAWAYRTVLTQTGDYVIGAQLPGTVSEATVNATIPEGVVFGGPGDCVGKEPPFGRIQGDIYIVNSCEYFGLIADRLGITFQELRNANLQIGNLNYITAGNELNIPPLP